MLDAIFKIAKSLNSYIGNILWQYLILRGQVSKGGEETMVQELQSPQVGFKISHHCGFDKKNEMII